MRRLVLFVFLIGFAAPAAADDAVKREWAAFAGTWRRVTYEADGRKTPSETAKRFRLTLRAEGTYALHADDQLIVEGKAHIDPTRNPKTIDMTPTTGRSKDKPLLGIYELNGDEYRICYSQTGKGRPATFEAGAGSGQVLTIYKRDRK